MAGELGRVALALQAPRERMAQPTKAPTFCCRSSIGRAVTRIRISDAVTARLTCFNSDLPSRLPFGNPGGDFELDGGGADSRDHRAGQADARHPAAARQRPDVASHLAAVAQLSVARRRRRRSAARDAAAVRLRRVAECAEADRRHRRRAQRADLRAHRHRARAHVRARTTRRDRFRRGAVHRRRHLSASARCWSDSSGSTRREQLLRPRRRARVSESARCTSGRRAPDGSRCYDALDPKLIGPIARPSAGVRFLSGGCAARAAASRARTGRRVRRSGGRGGSIRDGDTGVVSGERNCRARRRRGRRAGAA